MQVLHLIARNVREIYASVRPACTSRNVSTGAVVFLAVIYLLSISKAISTETEQPQARGKPDSVEISETPFSVLIAFGYGQPPQEQWKGVFSGENIDFEEAKGWFLSESDRISLDAFDFRTSESDSKKPTPKGLVLTGAAREGARISVATNHGGFEFSLEAVSSQMDTELLEGNVRVRGMLPLQKLSDDFRDDDYPSVAARGQTAWVVWQSFGSQSDEIRLRKYEQRWRTFTRVPNVSGDVWRPQVALDSGGRVWIVWSQQVNGNFDLYARAWDEENRQWLDEVRLSAHPDPDFDHHLIADKQGRLWVVWQGFREGNSEIFLCFYEDQSWSDPVRLTNNAVNDWEPRVAVDSQGRAHVVWDTYVEGNYDVHYRTWQGQPGPEVAVTSTPRFEAHATVAVDAQDRVWIAWDEAGANWGKDSGLTDDPDWRTNARESWTRWTSQPSQPGTRLYEHRKINMVVLDGPAARQPLEALEQAMQRVGIDNYDYPQLLIHRESQQVALLFHWWRPLVTEVQPDRLLFRLPVDNQQITDLGNRSPSWEQAVIFYDRDRWTLPNLIPESAGRPSMRASAAFGEGGQLWVGWPTDGRDQSGPLRNLVSNVYAGRFPATAEVGPPQLQDRDATQPPEVVPVHPNEAEEIAAMRAFRTRIDGKEQRIVRGDLHRHTEFSWDTRGNLDGSLFDFYRYMLDAASMDFGAVTDHSSNPTIHKTKGNGGNYEYAWWLIEKSCDMFSIPDRFVTLYGYERSLSFPFGHRNIFHADRGVARVAFSILPDFDRERPIPWGAESDYTSQDDTRLLYQSLRQTGGISIPHTTATSMGTNWSDNDPEVEPVVEIFQGDRNSYEHPDAPRSSRNEQGEAAGGYQEQGFVWNAYRKGYRIGTIASSDHWSTHISYAMVFMEGLTRAAILDAVRKRRTYGATDNIILEYRMGEHFMGEEFKASQAQPLQIHAIGTAPLSRVEIIKNERVIYLAEPRDRDFRVTYLDQHASPGTSYYYVRVIQADHEMAWSSPIWVTYESN